MRWSGNLMTRLGRLSDSRSPVQVEARTGQMASPYTLLERDNMVKPAARPLQMFTGKRERRIGIGELLQAAKERKGKPKGGGKEGSRQPGWINLT